MKVGELKAELDNYGDHVDVELVMELADGREARTADIEVRYDTSSGNIEIGGEA